MGEHRRRTLLDAEAENAEAERLRQLRACIEELLREFDACAVVHLAGRYGRFETFTALEATWSKVRIEQSPLGEGIRVRSKAADYAGDADAQRRELEWSVGVVSGFAELLAMQAVPWLKAARVIDDATGAAHAPWRRDDPRDEDGHA